MVVDRGTLSKILPVTAARRKCLVPWVAITLFALINLAFLCSFADRDGYEGDDLNSIVPMFHLDAAKLGALEIYRYPWQPLSYETGAAIIEVASARAVFLLSPVAATISLVLLLALGWHDSSSWRGLAVGLIVLLAVPEFWFSGLYYNSTIVGLPLALGSLALLRSQSRRVLVMLAGLSMGTAILMRLDFILICPAMALVAGGGRSFRRPVIFAASILTVLVLAYLVGWIRPLEIIELQRTTAAEIAEKAHMPGWDLRTKALVFTVLLSPIGWAIILLGAPWVVRAALRQSATTTLLWTLALIPPVIPLLNPLSPKYVLPLAVFLPTFLRQCVLAIEAHLSESMGRWPFRIAAIVTVLLLFVSITPRRRSPFVELATFTSRPVDTHDGTRSYGGYLWQAAAVDRVAPRMDAQLAANQIMRDFFNPIGPDIVIVGAENFFTRGAIGWRHLQLALEQAGVRGILKAPRRLQFDLNGRRLTLVRNIPSETAKEFDRGNGVGLVDLREPQD
jgi:hypothetical protein